MVQLNDDLWGMIINMKEKGEKLDRIDQTSKKNHKFMMNELNKLFYIINSDSEYDEEEPTQYIKDNFKMYIDMEKEIDFEKKDYFTYDVLEYLKI
eukprot:COSAG06_NODE_480_length_15163_cov_50.478757_8_plen_95_part_00